MWWLPLTRSNCQPCRSKRRANSRPATASHCDFQDVLSSAGARRDNIDGKTPFDGLLQIGHQGKHNGSNDLENFWRPAKIYEDPSANEVYIADGYGNRRVIVLDRETGKYKRHWGAYGNKPEDEKVPNYDPAAGVPKRLSKKFTTTSSPSSKPAKIFIPASSATTILSCQN